MKRDIVKEDLYKKAAMAIITACGGSLDDPNFTETPDRFARTMCNLFWSDKKRKKELKRHMKVEFPTSYDSMIFMQNIRTYSFCPHHLLPITYNTCIGYIPSKKGGVLGASKLVRIVDILGRQPIIQEQLNIDIAKQIKKAVKPRGIAVIMSGVHDCMRIRGVGQQEAKFETSVLRGNFMKNKSTRDEFFHMVMKG